MSDTPLGDRADIDSADKGEEYEVFKFAWQDSGGPLIGQAIVVKVRPGGLLLALPASLLSVDELELREHVDLFGLFCYCSVCLPGTPADPSVDIL